jgi:hypothetical protein
LAYRTLYLPYLGYSSLIIPPQPISFKPRLRPKAFSPFPHLRFITPTSRMICPSQLNSPYRIDSRTKRPRRLSSPNLFRLRRSKPVLTAKPPLRRYGVEMPRVNLCATLVVSLHFISFSRGVPLHNIHLTTCPMAMSSAACLSQG